MIDKVGIKINPKQAISIQIYDTLPDILPLLQRGLTGHEKPENDTETIHKMRLSISIGVSEEKERLLCRE